MNTNLVELVDKAITSPNFNRGKVYKALAEQLEAGNITITKEIKRQLYEAIDTKIKSLLPIGKKWTIVSCKEEHKLTGDGELKMIGRVASEDTVTVIPVTKEIVILKDQYVAVALKAVKQPTNESLPKQLRRTRNAIASRIVSLRITGVAENLTLAENYEKWLIKVSTVNAGGDLATMGDMLGVNVPALPVSAQNS